MGGWLCYGDDLDADMIMKAGFNLVFVSFYDYKIVDGKVRITDNRCCDPEG